MKADECLKRNARHGLVVPDVVIDPYDLPMSAARRVQLARRLPDQYTRTVLAVLDAAPRAFVVLGGRSYVDAFTVAFGGGRRPVVAPLQALPQRGIGYYKAWLAATANPAVPNRSAVRSLPGS